MISPLVDRLIACFILAFILAVTFIDYNLDLNHRSESELADLKQLFDGNNQFKISYKSHTNDDIPRVVGETMTMPEERGTLKLTTTFFALERGGLVKLSEQQADAWKHFVLDRLCHSEMLNAYDDIFSVIVVDVVAVHGDHSGQVVNIRASRNRCPSLVL